MHTPSIYRRILVGTAAVLVATAGLTTTPAVAQDRFEVFIAPFTPVEGARANFGRDVAKELRKKMDDLPTHQSLQDRRFKDALRQYGLKEEDLADCIKARQFAILIGVDLMICGTYTETDGTYDVTSKIVLTEQGSEFPLDPFQTRRHQDAAETMIAGFDHVNQTLRLAQFCADRLNQENWSEALTTCQEALTANPRSTTALYGLASANDKLDRPEDAMGYLQRLLEVEPQHEDALLFAGVMASRTGDKVAAGDYFHRYLELNPGNVDVRLQVATDAANAGNPEVALAIAEEAIPNSDDMRLKEYAGRFAINAAQQKEAAAGANGNAIEAMQLYDKALAYFEEVFQAQPDSANPSMLRNMLAAYRKLERTEEALDFGQRAIAAHGDDPQLLSAYADVLNQADRRDEALAMLDRVVRIDPTYAVNARKGNWMLAAGNLPAARTALEAAIANGEVEADAVARQIIGAGFNNFGNKNQHQAAIPYYELGKEFATTPHTRGMGNFFHGYAVYQLADPIAKARTRESAQRTLPMFRQVLQLMQGAEAYTEQSRNRNEILNAATQQIEIAELLIKQGG